MKNIIRMIDDNTAVVTKEFMKRASIFGSDEWKLMREFKAECPDVKVITKTIKKNPNKKVDAKNMTYEHMIEYIETMENKEELLKKFEVVRTRAKIQNNPYRFVLAWFMKEFNGYDDDYKKFFEELKNAA